jgi:hypothetical protein
MDVCFMASVDVLKLCQISMYFDNPVKIGE